MYMTFLFLSFLVLNLESNKYKTIYFDTHKNTDLFIQFFM